MAWLSLAIISTYVCTSAGIDCNFGNSGNGAKTTFGVVLRVLDFIPKLNTISPILWIANDFTSNGGPSINTVIQVTSYRSSIYPLKQKDFSECICLFVFSLLFPNG